MMARRFALPNVDISAITSRDDSGVARADADVSTGSADDERTEVTMHNDVGSGQPQGSMSIASSTDNTANINKNLAVVRRHRGSSRKHYGSSSDMEPQVSIEDFNPFIEDYHPSLQAPRWSPTNLGQMYNEAVVLLHYLVSSSVWTLKMIVDPPILRRPPIHYANVGSAEHLNGTGIKNTPSLRRMQDRTERQSLVLWWRPLVTLYYFIRECSTLFVIYMQQLGRNWRWLLLLLVALALAVGVYNIDGTHQEAIRSFERQVLWCAYWVGLGILSSVGLGTGLHTFVLYLGPHIAKVALAAYECGSVDFPEPPYPSSITCPEEAGNVAGITLWTIMSKVRLEAFMWGAGTAIGELPPYFMARAARLSGDDDIDDDDREELAELSMIEQKEQHPEELRQLSLLERMKVYVHALVHKAGFLGILACASIPNPLFDLAGITCGHFLIPFWTFFGATLIGKAIIKMHIQKLFVIFAFSQHHADQLVYLIKHIPFIGPSLKQPFEDLLKSQREKLHAKGGDANVTPGGTPWLSWLFEKVVTVMIVYFLVSIVNSFAQNYHKRLCKQQYDKERDDEEATRSYTTSSSGGGSSSSRRGYSTTTSSLSSLAATVAKDGLLKQS